jgi:predicted nucleotidyltransferase
MGRRVRRVPVVLHPSDEPPTPGEIDAILLAADEITWSAGRNGLTLILKGSRAAKVFEKGWDQVENYGALAHLTRDEIARKIDWMIHEGWLEIKYDWALPLIAHSEPGWERVQKLWGEKLLGEFETWVAEGRPDSVWPRIEPFHRQIKFQLLERIRLQQAQHLAPVLLAWWPNEVRKVRERIGGVLRDLGVTSSQWGGMPTKPARAPRRSWAELDMRDRLDHMADQFVREASQVQGVEEIVAFGSYVTAKPEPRDLDLMVFVSEDADIPHLAKCARRLTPIYYGWEVLLFEADTRRYLGRVCFRKQCPARSVDCAVPGCGAIPLVRAVLGFTFNPAQAFAHRPEVLWRRGEESIVERWYDEVQGRPQLEN